MNLSLAVIKAVSDDRGVIATAAMDQRDPLQKVAFGLFKAKTPEYDMLLAYEKTGHDKAKPGRLPDLLDNWSMRRLKELGVDCIKVLLYYTPTADPAINDMQRIGDECSANDIPYFLEFVGYQDGFDVMKVKAPVNMKFIEGDETLFQAAKAGVTLNGVLYGHAALKDAIPIYPKQGAKGNYEWFLSCSRKQQVAWGFGVLVPQTLDETHFQHHGVGL